MEAQNKNGKEKVVQTENRVENKKEEKKGTCGECKWYDVSTQRAFKRFGIREGLIETRAQCKSPTAKAHGHLVKKESTRPCFEAGTYTPVKKETPAPAENKKKGKSRPRKEKKKPKEEGSQ
jgi:hypothetical protein